MGFYQDASYLATSDTELFRLSCCCNSQSKIDHKREGGMVLTVYQSTGCRKLTWIAFREFIAPGLNFQI